MANYGDSPAVLIEVTLDGKPVAALSRHDFVGSEEVEFAVETTLRPGVRAVATVVGPKGRYRQTGTFEETARAPGVLLMKGLGVSEIVSELP